MGHWPARLQHHQRRPKLQSVAELHPGGWQPNTLANATGGDELAGVYKYWTSDMASMGMAAYEQGCTQADQRIGAQSRRMLAKLAFQTDGHAEEQRGSDVQNKPE